MGSVTNMGLVCRVLALALVGGLCTSGLASDLFNCQQAHCQCTEQVVTCSFGGLTKVPIFSPFLVQLNLTHNALDDLKPSLLAHLSLLQSLDLSHNRLVQLASFTFSGLGNLRQLNLAYNGINRIEKDSFKNLHELQELHLEGNPLKNLQGDVFYDLHSLERLTVTSWFGSERQKGYETKNQIAMLCQCRTVQEKWNIIGNFAFCNKLEQTVLDRKLGENCDFFSQSPAIILESALPKVNNELMLKEKTGKAPIWRHVPDSLVRAKSESVLVWRCEAEARPLPSLKWFKEGRLLSENATLRLGPIMPADEGTYECVASNEAGIAAKEVKLYVIGGSLGKQKSRYMMLDKMTKETSLQGNQIDRSKEIAKALANMTDFVENVRLLLRQSDGGSVDFPSVRWSRPDWLTPVQQMLMFNYTGCVGGSNVQVLDCRQFANYRAVTGVCNNLVHPLRGSQMTPFVRLLPSRYEDGLAKPVSWFAGKLYHNHPMPAAKLITRRLLSTEQLTADPKHNHMLMQFGQFLDHDLTFTAPSRSWNILENNVLDCRKMCDYVEPCFSVTARHSANHKSNNESSHSSHCIEVVRSAELCGTGFTSIVHGKFVPREQVNQLTAFIDGSNIYGSTDELARFLRDLNPDIGLLKTSQVDNKSYLPLSDEHFPLDCQLQPNASFMECFLAGDHRANEQIGLLAFHNIWLRQHNRLAIAFRSLHPNWSGEQIYQETRKIVGAQLQVITLRDWLPLIVGKAGIQMMGEYGGYNSSVDATISNVFATAAMRFGHTLVSTHLIKQMAARSASPRHDMKLRKLFFASHMLYQPRRLDSIMRGLLATPLKKPMPEQAISSELTEHLFELSRHVPLDLASINIQRGRDHALPSYNQWRTFCGLKRADTFEQLTDQIVNADIRDKLKQLYGHPDNIDLWVGAIMEEAAGDAKVGPTFRCLLVDQFKKLRDGDRLWYKAAGVFTTEQLVQIEKTTLAKVICANSDHIGNTTRDAFVLTEHQSSTDCALLPDVDLTKW